MEYHGASVKIYMTSPYFEVNNHASNDFLMRETMVIKNVICCDNFHAAAQIFQTSLIQTGQ